ncbi:MAG TPA: hypothetical protein VHC42_05395 [Rhizomicrobium sp.]|nr:hypothetical protein [Rhizomicrobium sp.]
MSAAVSQETSREHDVRRRDNICPRCGSEPRIAGQAYGYNCHAAYQRRWRETQRLRREAEKKELEFLRAKLSAMETDDDAR